MGFALLSVDSRQPDAESVRRVIDRLDFLSRHDARALLERMETGILLLRLTEEQARQARIAFAAAGIEAEAVDESELMAMPAPLAARRMSVDEAGLTIYDALQRPVSVGAEHVVIVAAGLVGRQVIEYERREWKGPDDRTSIAVPYRFAMEFERFEPHLEVFLDVEPLRVKIDPASFDYRYLGDRKGLRSEENFPQLVGDLIRIAPAAMLNRGACSMALPDVDPITYPSRRHFEQELMWLVWRAGRGAPGADA